MKRGIKGQITIFIILAILIVGTISAIVVINRNPTIKINPKIEPIYQFISNCIKETGEDAIIYVSLRGGSFENPEHKTNDNITIYVEKGVDFSLRKEQIEKSVSRYMDQYLKDCINDFKDFSDFSINYKNSNTITKIEKNKVVFYVNYPIDIKKDGKSYALTKFDGVEINARLGTVFSVAKNISEEQVKAPKDICVSCLEDFAITNDVYIDVNNYDPYEIIYTVIDEKSKINSKDLEFVFATRL